MFSKTDRRPAAKAADAASGNIVSKRAACKGGGRALFDIDASSFCAKVARRPAALRSTSGWEWVAVFDQSAMATTKPVHSEMDFTRVIAITGDTTVGPVADKLTIDENCAHSGGTVYSGPAD